MILVTGANGRLGRTLVATLAQQGFPVRAAARHQIADLPSSVDGVALGALDGQTDWRQALAGVDTVIHCASLTWVQASDGKEALRRANVDAVVRMSAMAGDLGVRRIVYVSSISVNGKHNTSGPFRHDDAPNPESDYSQSKLDAEIALRASLVPEVVIVRPPRIIWPDLSGNLAFMGKLIAKGIPLPFGLLDHNRRDNIRASNLISALILSATCPAAAGHTFLVSDQQPLSTRELAIHIGDMQGRKPILLPVPGFLLRAIVFLLPQSFLGKLDARGILDELTRDLCIDISHIQQVTGWTPSNTSQSR